LKTFPQRALTLFTSSSRFDQLDLIAEFRNLRKA
jgi:hypothetical protein